MLRTIVEGEPGIFPDPVARLMRTIGGWFDRRKPADAGPQDAGPQDAEPQDPGPQDAGAPDAEPQDARSPDTGSPDAGPQDAGAPPPGAADPRERPAPGADASPATGDDPRVPEGHDHSGESR